MNGGKSQSQILREFTSRQIAELSIYDSIFCDSGIKQDIRQASLMALIESMFGKNKFDPKRFMFKWSCEKEEFTKEQICARSKAHWKSWISANKRNNKKQG